MSDRTLMVKFEGKVDPSLEKAASRTTAIATGIGTALGTLASKGLIAIGDGIKTFFDGAIEQGSKLNEATNVTTLVFGDQAKAMDGFFKSSATSIGMSESSARSASANIGGLLQNMGFANKESADWSKTLLTLGADMGSAFNKDPEQAIQAIGAGLRGESEPLKAFNVFLDDASIKAKAMEMGLYSGKGALDQHAKAQAALALITQQTAKVQGDFANTAEDEANASRIVAAQYENLQAKVGTQLLPAKKALLSIVSDQLIPAFSGFVDGLKGAGEWIQKNSTWLAPLGVAVGVLAVGYGILAGVQAAVNLQNTIMAAGGIIKFIQAWAAQQTILNVALSANPIGLVVIAVAALAAGLIYAYNNSEQFRAAVDTGFKAIGAAGTWLWNNALAPVVRFIVNGFATIVGGIGEMLTALGNIPGFGWAKDAGEAMKGAANQARTLADNIRDIPENKKIEIGIHTIYTTTGVAPSGNIVYKTGNGALFEAAGGFVQFFAGGGENHRAQYARPGDLRIWAEPETGGEWYLPMAASKRADTIPMWEQAGRDLGVLSYAGGGQWDVLRTGATRQQPTSPDRNIVADLITALENARWIIDARGIGDQVMLRLETALARKALT